MKDIIFNFDQYDLRENILKNFLDAQVNAKKILAV